MMRTHIFKTIALVVLLQFCAVANFSLFTLHSSLLYAQGLPLIRNYTALEYGGHNRNFDIEIGDDGTVFVANFEGLLYYDRARWRMIHTSDISRVTVVFRDSKNVIWVGGYNLFARLEKRPNGELFLRQIGQDGLFTGEVMEIFEDEGTLQFVVTDNNIYEVRDAYASVHTGAGEEPVLPTIALKRHTNTHFRPGIDSDVVSLDALKEGNENALLEDITQTEELDGGLVVKVKKNNGLIIADDQGHDLYTITEANGLCSNMVSYVAYDGHGVLWGATLHGIFAIELPSVFSYFLPKDGLAGEIHAITAFNGKIFVGGTNGLYSIASRQCKRIADINNICWTLCESRGGLLAATSSGIYRIASDGSVSRQTSNATTALLVDNDKVYAGEADGVYCYTDQGDRLLSQPSNGELVPVNQLPLVTDIRKDAQGNLWFLNVHGKTACTGNPSMGDATEPGNGFPLSVMNEEVENRKSANPRLFMPVRGIEVKAQYIDSSRVWIGGDEILAIIDTDKKDLATLIDSRTIRFCSIIIGNDSVLWGGYGDMPGELPKIDSDERHLHFFYTLDYAPLSGKTLYRYKLENESLMGTSGQWSVWTEKQDVEFLNLPYGSFTLHVQARLANGELSEVASVDFSIAYPLLMRWYMVLLYFIGFAYLVYLLFRYRLKRLQKDKIKLERIVRERTSEVVRQKDEIEQKSRSLEKALDDLSNAQHELIRQEKMATVGKLTEGLIDRILNPMNYIINFSKMSNDLLKDLKENVSHNKDRMDEEDYEDTQDVLDMLTENLQHVDQYGQNTTRTLKAMEEMLKDRTGGYVEMDLLMVLQQNEQMLNNYYAKEKEQYHIQTTFTLPGEAMPMIGNPDLLSRTIMSLLGNAVYAVVKKTRKATTSPLQGEFVPEISFSAAVSPGGTYILKLRDNGIGIEEKIIDKIFDPFFTTKTTDEAAGVGLYLSREILQNHGGDISVESVKDQYTEFTISLPRVKNKDKEI